MSIIYGKRIESFGYMYFHESHFGKVKHFNSVKIVENTYIQLLILKFSLPLQQVVCRALAMVTFSHLSRGREIQAWFPVGCCGQ